MDNNSSEHSNHPGLKREFFYLFLVAVLAVLAFGFLFYKAAFCFDPYYTHKTTGIWPKK